MSYPHFGYADAQELAIRELLGDDYMTHDLSVTYSKAWIDIPTRTGTIDTHPTGRSVLVVEGEDPLDQEILGKNFQRRVTEINARLNQKAGRRP